MDTPNDDPQAASRSGLRRHRVLEGTGDWQSAHQRDELRSREARLRMMLLWGGLAYLAFLPIDVAFNLMRDSGQALAFVVARLLGAVPLAAMLVMLRARPEPSLGRLMLFDVLGTSSVASVIAFMAVRSGGVESPVLAGLVPVLVARAIGLADPWRRGLVLTIVPALVFWLVVLLGSALDPTLGLGVDGRRLAVVIMHLGITAVTILLVTLGSHAGWLLRRTLIQARHVGRYELLRRIGQGGMGEVWAAWHQGLRQEVAIKILSFSTHDSGRVARFEQEVAATIKLRHPNTVRVYDFGLSADGHWYYVMELLEGETLAALLAREGPLGPERALAILRQAARAIAEAHSLGIVHRDIKPENLLIGPLAGEPDFVKVLDFGVASFAEVRHADEDASTEPTTVVRPSEAASARSRGRAGGRAAEDAARTNVGRTVGTPLYLSPEVARGQAAGPPSDVYALGCVLFFMLTGRPPFIDADPRSLLLAHAELPPPRLTELLDAELPSYVEALVSSCLIKDPERRMADAGLLVEAIDRCLRLAEDDRRRGVTLRAPRLRQGFVPPRSSQTETDISLLD